MATTFDLVYNYDLRRLVQSVLDYTTPLLDSEIPYIYYGMENVLVRLTVVSNTGSLKNLSAGVVNKFATIKDSANDTDSALVTSSRVNENGTWIASANPALASGQVTVILNTVTATLLDKLNTNRYIDNTRLQIKLRDVDNYLLFPIDIPVKCMKEDATDDSVVPPTPDSGYMTSPTVHVENNIVTFNATGGGKDSGYKLNDTGTNTTSLWSANKVISYVATVGGISSGGTSTDNAIVLWNGASGGILKDSAVLLPTSDIVGLDDEQTLTNKTLTSPIINTPTGITADDIGLDNVDNTADANKVVASAGKLTTARKINTVDFDGTADITITAIDSTKVPLTRTVNSKALSSNIVLDKTDIGLNLVDNTADVSKEVLSATKLKTARTINGVSFDGTANITVADGTKVPTTTTVNGHALSGNVTVSKSDVSLGNVTDDAQLKRASADFNTFTAKTPVLANDIVLIEDSASSYAKKKVTMATLATYMSTNATGNFVQKATSSTDSVIALWDGTTGNKIKNSTKVVPSGIIVGTTDAQTLTNKTMTNPVVTDSITLATQITNPSNPATGYLKLFTKNDGHTYIKDSAGTLTVLDKQIQGYPETSTFTSADIGKPIVAGTSANSNAVQIRNVSAVSTISVDDDEALNVSSGVGTNIGQYQIAFIVPVNTLSSLTTKMVISTLYPVGADIRIIAYDGDYDRTVTPPQLSTILSTSATIASGKSMELVTIESSISAASQTNVSIVINITTTSSYTTDEIAFLLSSLEIYDTNDLATPLFIWKNHTAITGSYGGSPDDSYLCGEIAGDSYAELGDGIPVYNAFGTLYTVKTTPANNDRIAINDSADSYAMKYISISSLNYRYTVGAGSAVSDNFVSFDGTTGKLIKDSGYSASDLENVPTADEKDALDNATVAIDASNPVASMANLADKADLVGGLVPTSQLPGFVEEVKEFADMTALEVTETGAYASVVYDTVTLTAVELGEIGNSIALVFNGTDTLTTVVDAWNTGHATNTVGFTGQAGSYVPTAGTATLVGGVDLVSTGVIYITLDDNKQWRWGGTVFVELSASLVLGETAGTAYVGNKGKTAYDHSQLSGNAHNLTLTDLAIPNVTNTKNNYESILNPDADKDNTVGYSVGSVWVNTATALSYICTDATTGNAVWNVQSSGSMDDVGTGVGIYAGKLDETFYLKSLTSSGGTVSIIGGIDEINIESVGNNSVIPFESAFTSASVAPFQWNDNVVTVTHGRDKEFNMIALYNDTTNELLDYPVETINSNSLKIYFPIGLVPVADTYRIVCSNVGGNHTSIVQNYATTDESITLSREQQIYTISVNANTTFTFDTSVIVLVSGEACTFELDIKMLSVKSLVFPVNVVWLYGTPSMAEIKTYRLVFHSIDQGTTWYGNLAFERTNI